MNNEILNLLLSPDISNVELGLVLAESQKENITDFLNECEVLDIYNYKGYFNRNKAKDIHYVVNKHTQTLVLSKSNKKINLLKDLTIQYVPIKNLNLMTYDPHGNDIESDDYKLYDVNFKIEFLHSLSLFDLPEFPKSLYNIFIKELTLVNMCLDSLPENIATNIQELILSGGIIKNPNFMPNVTDLTLRWETRENDYRKLISNCPKIKKVIFDFSWDETSEYFEDCLNFLCSTPSIEIIIFKVSLPSAIDFTQVKLPEKTYTAKYFKVTNHSIAIKF